MLSQKLKCALTVFVSLATVAGLNAQSNTVRLSLEFSTNGLSSWQRVPLTAAMLNNGDLDLSMQSSNSFYRMRVAMFPPEAQMVTVQGGTIPMTSWSLAGTPVATFRIGKYEVTWQEWQDVRAWAVNNGYTDIAGSGAGSATNHPVRDVSLYDILKWINARSEREGLVPVYRVGGATYRTGQFVPTREISANGYRLPTSPEFEWAAGGGQLSQNYTYSGSNDINAVSWYADNSFGAAVDLRNGKGTWPVGSKAANELGTYDMSGNVWEWVWDFQTNSQTSIVTGRYRGGGWNTTAGTSDVRNAGDPTRTPDRTNFDLGFRLARDAAP